LPYVAADAPSRSPDPEVIDGPIFELGHRFYSIWWDFDDNLYLIL
jgi:hypothetical protein